MMNRKWSLRLAALGLVVLAAVGVALVPEAEASSSCSSACRSAYGACASECSLLPPPHKPGCFSLCRRELRECLAGC